VSASLFFTAISPPSDGGWEPPPVTVPGAPSDAGPLLADLYETLHPVICLDPFIDPEQRRPTATPPHVWSFTSADEPLRHRGMIPGIRGLSHARSLDQPLGWTGRPSHEAPSCRFLRPLSPKPAAPATSPHRTSSCSIRQLQHPSQMQAGGPQALQAPRGRRTRRAQDGPRPRGGGRVGGRGCGGGCKMLRT
jgi:hypothetical protein